MDLRRLGLLFLLFFLICSHSAFAVLVGEEDGSPSHTANACWALKMANGNVTKNADGTCSIADQSGGSPSEDSIGTTELDDGADTPASGEYIRVDTVDQAGIEYRTASETRSDLSLAIGSDVQAWDTDLDTWATITPGSNVGTWLATPSSANLRSALTDETGTGEAVFSDTPTLTTPAFSGNTVIAGPSSGNTRGSDDEIIQVRRHATDCTAITDGKSGEPCYEQDADAWYVCEPSSGDCDTAGEWIEISGGSGSMPNKEYSWPAAALMPLEHANDNVPPISKLAGTNVDHLVRLFNDSQKECVSGTFNLTGDLDTSGSATFHVDWDAVTAAADDVVWSFNQVAVASGENWDTSLASVTNTATANATQKLITQTTFTETISNLDWTADDFVAFEFCREGGNMSDTLTGDSRLFNFKIEVPQA